MFLTARTIDTETAGYVVALVDEIAVRGSVFPGVVISSPRFCEELRIYAPSAIVTGVQAQQLPRELVARGGVTR